MNYQSFPFLLFVLLTAASCQKDTEPVSPINQLSRFDGWQIVTVESNIAAAADSTVAALPDSTVAQSGRTREEIRESLNPAIRGLTGVDDCERDDALFFESGVVAYGVAGTACDSTSLPHVLTPFNRMRYATDIDVTTLTIISQDETERTPYNVERINGEELVIQRQRRMAENLLVPAYPYNITYFFRAR
ncbi:hypothetical protein [Lewinella sp. IMCC34183]|uniref:hypothetical protein n=1 Tax=Lewinella sp. IMCC34183 TaxID=2248762 RepID=UPI000E25E7C3|nr:hypothetical protein [Lewinella sp. IMCC34183]